MFKSFLRYFIALVLFSGWARADQQVDVDLSTFLDTAVAAQGVWFYGNDADCGNVIWTQTQGASLSFIFDGTGWAIALSCIHGAGSVAVGGLEQTTWKDFHCDGNTVVCSDGTPWAGDVNLPYGTYNVTVAQMDVQGRYAAISAFSYLTLDY